MTIDIPDSLYRKLRATAAQNGVSVEDIVVELVREKVVSARRGIRIQLPLVKAKETRKLDITNQEINEILDGATTSRPHGHQR